MITAEEARENVITYMECSNVLEGILNDIDKGIQELSLKGMDTYFKIISCDDYNTLVFIARHVKATLEFAGFEVTLGDTPNNKAITVKVSWAKKEN